LLKDFASNSEPIIPNFELNFILPNIKLTPFSMKIGDIFELKPLTNRCIDPIIGAGRDYDK